MIGLGRGGGGLRSGAIILISQNEAFEFSIWMWENADVCSICLGVLQRAFGFFFGHRFGKWGEAGFRKYRYAMAKARWSGTSTACISTLDFLNFAGWDNHLCIKKSIQFLISKPDHMPCFSILLSDESICQSIDKCAGAAEGVKMSTNRYSFFN